jgi:hypothetical protein
MKERKGERVEETVVEHYFLLFCLASSVHPILSVYRDRSALPVSLAFSVMHSGREQWTRARSAP